MQKEQVINLSRFDTPLGQMVACADAQALCLLEFADKQKLDAELEDLKKRFNAVILPGKNPHLDQVQKQVEEYFLGERKNFSVPLKLSGTDFQQSVWRELQHISYGSTRSYKEQAQALKNPRAVRAVASANANNRIVIVIPCHRVIGSNGSLTGYSGGIKRKKWLIDLERNI